MRVEDGDTVRIWRLVGGGPGIDGILTAKGWEMLAVVEDPG